MTTSSGLSCGHSRAMQVDAARIAQRNQGPTSTIAHTAPTPAAENTAASASPSRDTEIALGPNHFKLLYLISLYAVASNSTKQNERWVRHVPLLVLMFEGIVRGKFDFDYAPASMRLSFKGKTLRRWINVSREGKAAIDDLWQLRLINGLKLSSDDFQPITAYQVSMKGQLVLQQLPGSLKEDIDSFVYPPPPIDHKLVIVAYDGDRFVLKSGPYSKPSTITESEDVSYVSSPFLPRCLRSDGFYHISERSNSDRADECARGFANITKKTSEAISLGDVYALIGEWVPFGSNQIVALNERMGALDRCQGGILTSFVDKSPTDTQFRVPVGQTQVRILDFDFVRFINFEAESHFPETPGIVQVEHFGMHLNSDGSLIYGVKVEAIMDRKGDDISVDHLSRLLVDIHQDSSLLVNDLLSRYQLGLLEMIYLGDSFQRNKYNCILAKQIRPKLPASEYVSNPLYANELAQVLGDIITSYDLSSDDILVVGKAGCMFCGPNVFRYENVFTAYVGLVCRDMFIKNFFARTFVLDASLKEIRQLIRRVHREPAAALRVREKLASASRDTILLAETLEYLLDSLEDIQIAPQSPRNCSRPQSAANASLVNDEVDARLLQALALPQMKAQTIMRCHDSIKLMENTMLQLEQLQMIAESTATNQLERVCRRVNLNTRALMAASERHIQSSLKLRAMQYFVGGIFVFDVIDRIDAGSWNMHVPEWVRESIVDPLFARPFAWWTINMVILCAFALVLVWISKQFAERAFGFCTVSFEINRKISRAHLDELLSTRLIRSDASKSIRASVDRPFKRFRVVKWRETDVSLWGGAPPEVELTYDDKHCFLLFAALRFDAKRARALEAECIRKFEDVFKRNGVLLEPGAP